MKTYIFKHSLLGVIVGLSILGCTEGDKFDYNKKCSFYHRNGNYTRNKVCSGGYPFFVCNYCLYHRQSR